MIGPLRLSSRQPGELDREFNLVLAIQGQGLGLDEILNKIGIAGRPQCDGPAEALRLALYVVDGPTLECEGQDVNPPREQRLVGGR